VKKNSKIFQEISDVEKKSVLLASLAREAVTIKARTFKKIEFEAYAQSWNPPFRLEVKPTVKDLKLGLESLIIQFDFKDERYFSKVELAFDDWKLFFIFVSPLYRLQRRQYRRFKIPKKMNNEVFLMRTNDQLRNEQCEIIDISEGGCSLRVSYDSLEIPHQAIALIDLRLGKMDSFLQMGRVRYKKAEKWNGRSVVRMGIEFKKNAKSDQQLQKVINLLSTDLFQTWSSHP